MMTVVQALQEFISDLELTPLERDRVAEQKEEVREYLRAGLTLEEDFLTGSYARHTAIRPLNDVDMFIVLDGRAHGDLLAGPPTTCLKAVRRVLDKAYPTKDLPILQSRSVGIDFSSTGVGYDIVPAFRDGDNYQIPDREADRWIRSNPRIHKEFATRCNEAAGSKLNPLVKALKQWNVRRQKPLRSFHLEVMAGRILNSPPGSYLDGLSTLFHSLASAVDRACPEPARLGPDLDIDMSSGARQHARELLRSAGESVDKAIVYKDDGRTGQAHHLLRDLFGPDYPEKGSPESSLSKAPAIVTGGSTDSSKHRFG